LGLVYLFRHIDHDCMMVGK